jgi:hypothetical protein
MKILRGLLRRERVRDDEPGCNQSNEEPVKYTMHAFRYIRGAVGFAVVQF